MSPFQLSIPGTSFGGTGNVTYDRVASLSKPTSETYLSFVGQFSTARQLGSFGIPITFGAAWGLHSSNQYAGPSLGISVPFKALSSSLQTKIWAAMANCVADNDNPLELVNQLKSRIPFPDFIKDFGPDVEGQIASVSKGLISVLDRTEITIFTDSGFDYCGVEATFNANIFQEANGEGTTNLSVNVGVSKPLGPEVSF